VIESEKQSTHTDDTNGPTVTETNDQNEKLESETPDDSVSSVTQKLEDIQVTVDNENSTPVTEESG
jgi:hypothetical protein